jgi:hypothetical protein
MIIGFYGVKTIYRDHQALVNKINELTGERDSYKKANETKDIKIAAMENRLNAPQRHAMAKEAAPTSTVQPPPVPMPNLASIRIASQKQIISTDPQLPYGLEVVLQTDKSIEHVAFAIEFTGTVSSGFADLSPGGVYIDSRRRGIYWKKYPNLFGFSWTSPAFTPDEIISVKVYSKEYIRALRLIDINTGKVLWP